MTLGSNRIYFKNNIAELIVIEDYLINMSMSQIFKLDSVSSK